MADHFDANDFNANDMRIALNEIYPESTYGAIPVINQYDALDAYLAFDDGTLAEAPHASAAYVSHQQRFAV